MYLPIIMCIIIKSIYISMKFNENMNNENICE